MPSRLTITQEVTALVGNAHREQGVLTIAEYVDLAVRDVEKVSPRHYRRTLTGDGTDEYALAEPWERGFSVVERVRWVAGADFNAKAVWLTQDQWETEYARTAVTSEAVGNGDGATKTFALDEDFATQDGSAVTVNAVAVTAYTIEGNGNGSRIVFTTAPTNGHAIVASYFTVTPQIRFSLSPSSSDRVVVEHTSRHTLSDYVETSTVNDTEASATARRAAVLLLRAAAASVNSRVPQATDEDFAEAGIGSAAAEYRRLADDYDEEYKSLLGIGADVPSVATYASVSANYNRRNESPLTHPRRSASWQG